MRTPAAKTAPRIAIPTSFPAPVGGWIANQNLAAPNARNQNGTRVNGAAHLENWLPTATGIRMRGGSDVYATIGGSASRVLSLFTYINGNNDKLFAANANSLSDITNVVNATDFQLADEDGNLIVDEDGTSIGEWSTIPELSGLSGGAWSAIQFATPGGVFLRAVNGVDTPLVYDGTTWATTPEITVAPASSLSHVWEFKSRLFFIEKDSLNVWYLAADNIGGDAVKLPLGGVFGRGGSLMFGASWSLDTGSGLSEQCVFVTTEGEVAVFQGTDPSTAQTWSKVGVYRIGKPRGPKAFIRAGADLVIATDVGFVPLSQAIQRDFAALAPAAVSYPIEVAWNAAIASRTFSDWACEVWPTKQMVLVALPTQDGDQAQMFAANARTGAWGLFTGWDGSCLITFNDRLFFGSADGEVVEAEVTGADQGATYTAVCVPLFDALKNPATLKTGLQGRAVILAPSAVGVDLSLQADYTIVLPSAPDDTSVSSGGAWGEAVWGQSVWGTAATKVTFQDWQSTPGSGYALSVAVQITSGKIVPPDVELVQIDLTYDMGDIGT